MQITIPDQPKGRGQSTNRQFSYGSDRCNTLCVVCLCPLFCGSFPTQAYTTLVFNNQKQRIEKYSHGFGIWVCSSVLQTTINYSQITSMTRQQFIYTWSKGSCVVNVIIIFCGKKQITLYIPEDACYAENDSGCCLPFAGNGLDCCRDRYEKLSIEILDYWRSIQGSVTQQQLMNGLN